MLKKYDIIKHKSFPRCTFYVKRIWEGFVVCGRIKKVKNEWVSWGENEKFFAESPFITKIGEW